MAKGKSSASSATRKKHARKAAGPMPVQEALPTDKKPKGKDKGKNKEPRQKIYIPPSRPAPIQPDPLDTMGLARVLPPELYIVLRMLGKKNAVTKGKALEELQSAWVDKAKKEGDESLLIPPLVAMLPVWFHHLPALFFHPVRQVRLLTAALHASLLQISSVRDALFLFLTETLPADQVECILGAWCMTLHGVDFSASSYSHNSWNEVVSLCYLDQKGIFALSDDVHIPALLSFTQRVLLDPDGAYLQLNPPAPASTSIVHPSKKVVFGRPAPLVKRDESSANSRPKAEEDEESEQDRRARLRIGALGAVKWVLDHRPPSSNLGDLTALNDLFSNPATWTSLYHAEIAPFCDIPAFGYNQSNVRKSAWLILQTLLRRWKSAMQSFLPVLSTAVLRSAWVESDPLVRSIMWQPLLIFLKEFPNSWNEEITFKSDAHEEDSDSDESDRENDEDGTQELPPAAPTKHVSYAFQDFLQFLALGCAGSPVQGYPTVVIVISTIPPSILASSPTFSPLTDFFISFWAAIDGRALSSVDREAASSAFLSALLECTVFLIRRIRNHPATLLGPGTDGSVAAINVVKEQLQRTWEEVSSRKLRVEAGTAGKLVARTLVSLQAIEDDLSLAAWITLSDLIKTNDSAQPSLIYTLLSTFDKEFQDGTNLKIATWTLICEVTQSAVVECQNMLKRDDDTPPIPNMLLLLTTALDTLGTSLFADDGLAHSIDRLISSYAFRLLSVSPPLLLSYLSKRNHQQQCSIIWHDILSAISQHGNTILSSLPPLLDAAGKGILPIYLSPRSGELDFLAGNLLADALSDSEQSVRLGLVGRILATPGPFLSQDGFRNLVSSLVEAFTYQLDIALRDPSIPLVSFKASLETLQIVVHSQPQLASPKELVVSLLPDIFIFAYLLSRCDGSDSDETVTMAKGLWEFWFPTATQDLRSAVGIVIKDRLRSLLYDCLVRPSPEAILHTINEASPDLKIGLLLDIFPSRTALDAMLNSLPADPLDPSLAVLHPLIPSAPTFHDASFSDLNPTFDSLGYSPYARIVSALLQVFADDRQSARENLWALRHFLALVIFADDSLNLPLAPSVVFGQHVATTSLGEIITKVQQLSTYLLTSSLDNGWHANVVNAIMDDKIADVPELLAKFVIEVVKTAKRRDNVLETRILRVVLQHVLANANKDEADQWLSLSRKIEKSAPETWIGIVSSVTEFAPEPLRLDRYRNELASSLFGVPATKAGTEGLLLLRKLIATAPDLESDVVFLPQLRVVNVMKTFQQWITSDEDLDEDVQSLMTLMFLHVAPILQNVPGAHWELILDVIENNLEMCSFADESTLVTLSRTLRLIVSIQDLASSNKSLRADWRERHISILALVRDLVSAQPGTLGVSVPRSICRELALSIVQDLPPSLIDQTTLSSMCHLLSDHSLDVQKMSYQLLQEAAKKRTEHLVIETGVDAEATVKAELPKELIDILQRSFEHEFEDGTDGFGYLLGWMVTFDLFTDASVKVRSGYIEQLRDLDIVATHFLPTIFEILNLEGGILKAFKLEPWAVDEFYISLFEPGMLSLQLLAAHLYYRALLTIPYLIRSWVLDCKDRQLSAAIFAYTSQHFSPVIIQTEMARVKSPQALADLVDENFTVKVATAVNEVVASYLVDEHHLEITLKLPSDWPLHPIEVTDRQKVGVMKDRWRAWVLGVLKWAQGGYIVDALSLFKKNVAGHFEGQVECAICYSIINATDYTLPEKPCRTCKNRFHAGCLYKWFSTSHTSSCPLCRSDIM